MRHIADEAEHIVPPSTVEAVVGIGELCRWKYTG